MTGASIVTDPNSTDGIHQRPKPQTATAHSLSVSATPTVPASVSGGGGADSSATKKIQRVGDANSSDEEGSTATEPMVPMHLPYTWTHPDSLQSIITIAINPPSGVKQRMIKADVSSDGMQLQVVMTWPKCFSDTMRAMDPFINSTKEDRISKDHPRRMGYEESLKAKRKTNKTRLRSLSIFPLPFKVRKDICRVYTKKVYEEGELVRMVHVDMQSAQGDYNVIQQDSDSD